MQNAEPRLNYFDAIALSSPPEPLALGMKML